MIDFTQYYTQCVRERDKKSKGSMSKGRVICMRTQGERERWK